MKWLNYAGVVTAVLLCACQKGSGVERVATADVAAPAAAVTAAGALFPDAGRAEALLEAAGVAFFERNDLIGAAAFPEGCAWRAVYSTRAPEVILETFAFTDEVACKNWVAAKERELAAQDVFIEYALAANGNLALFAHFDPSADADGKREIMQKFVRAFSPASEK